MPPQSGSIVTFRPTIRDAIVFVAGMAAALGAVTIDRFEWSWEIGVADLLNIAVGLFIVGLIPVFANRVYERNRGIGELIREPLLSVIDRAGEILERVEQGCDRGGLGEEEGHMIVRDVKRCSRELTRCLKLYESTPRVFGGTRRLIEDAQAALRCYKKSVTKAAPAAHQPTRVDVQEAHDLYGDLVLSIHAVLVHLP